MTPGAAPSSNDNVINILAGATAGMVGRLLFHPIDTCKSKIQANDTFRGIGDVVRRTWSKEGPLGFYRGLGIVLVGGIPGVCIYLSSYESCKVTLQQNTWLSNNAFAVYFTSGMVAEAVCCTVFVPVDVVKERLQVQSSNGLAAATASSTTGSSAFRLYSGSLDALRTILREEGIVRGLYKGYGATLLSFGPYSAFYFVFYEELKGVVAQRQHQQQDQPQRKHDRETQGKKLRSGNDMRDSSSVVQTLSFTQNLLCAASAGGMASVLTNPLDLAKLRYQIQRNELISSAGVTSEEHRPLAGTGVTAHHGSKNEKRKVEAVIGKSVEPKLVGLGDALRTVYRTSGWRGLLRGSLTRVLFNSPCAAVTMAVFEECKDFWRRVLEQ